MIKIFIADDHELFRDGLRSLLDSADGVTVVGEATDSRQTLEGVRASHPEVVLLDLSMPGRGGLENLLEVKRLDPRIRVLIVTAHPEDDVAIRCLTRGADGYLTKSERAEVLIAAIRKVAAGRKYISPVLAERLASRLGAGDGPPHAALSDREFQVLGLVASGLSSTQIAQQLCLSIKTISTYRSRILEKLGLDNSSQIIRYAIEQGLVDTG